MSTENIFLALFKDRLRNPFWSFLATTEIAWHWKAITTFIVKAKSETPNGFLEYLDTITIFYSWSALTPIGIALVLTVLSPWIHAAISYFAVNANIKISEFAGKQSEIDYDKKLEKSQADHEREILKMTQKYKDIISDLDEQVENLNRMLSNHQKKDDEEEIVNTDTDQVTHSHTTKKASINDFYQSDLTRSMLKKFKENNISLDKAILRIENDSIIGSGPSVLDSAFFEAFDITDSQYVEEFFTFLNAGFISKASGNTYKFSASHLKHLDEKSDSIKVQFESF
ncbi:MAG: hypothetical protein NE334_13425 [Lentisphaeraceae bacterium]|nr:hypothetical protein [Lentisphaeraceae bacterium]